jgi:hypothetical protein
LPEGFLVQYPKQELLCKTILSVIKKLINFLLVNRFYAADKFIWFNTSRMHEIDFLKKHPEEVHRRLF